MINGNVDSQGAPSAPSQAQIRRNYHPSIATEWLPHSNYATAADDSGISHWFSRIIEGAVWREVMKLYLDQPSLVASSSAVGRRTPKMGHMIWPGEEEPAAKGAYDGVRTH
jgi:hypothetical protein